jgi:hypothetical protein
MALPAGYMAIAKVNGLLSHTLLSRIHPEPYAESMQKTAFDFWVKKV